ncbi:atrial natriuretic peptide receptor 3-like [Artemia franciscana]|uniref:atrial natriuretic peptide receptor 3-like n=1 Tax=Artemia franciscana TaxID=6661 RepID=UPI0032DA8551
MEEHQCYNVMKLDEIVPTMISAVAYVNKHWNFHHWKFDTIYEDTNCSSVKGPLAAIEFRGKADVIFGPICDYVISPVAKYAAAWSLPLITPAALGDAFGMRSQYYSSLIRIMGSFVQSAEAVHHMVTDFKWRRFGVLYYEYDYKSGQGHSGCYFLLDAIYKNLNPFPTDVNVFHRRLMMKDNVETLLGHLNYLKAHSRIILLCGSQDIVRRIMLAADSLGMTSSGEYVFINIDFFRSVTSHSFFLFLVLSIFRIGRVQSLQN